MSIFLLTTACISKAPGKWERAPCEGTLMLVPAVPNHYDNVADTAFARLELYPRPWFLENLQLQRVTVDDPVYKKTKRYEGFLLADVLNAAKMADASHTYELVFVCVDGYSPAIPFDLARSEGAVLAVRDIDAPRGGEWDPLRKRREIVVPGPFYLVWRLKNAERRGTLPWPYQIIAIELWNSDQRSQNIGSVESEPVARGFDLFRRNCRQCHSINLAGGT